LLTNILLICFNFRNNPLIFYIHIKVKFVLAINLFFFSISFRFMSMAKFGCCQDEVSLIMFVYLNCLFVGSSVSHFRNFFLLKRVTDLAQICKFRFRRKLGFSESPLFNYP